MDIKEKLVELILNADNDQNLGLYDLYDLTHERTGCAKYFAEYLFAHGVTVQEWYSAENPPKEDGTYLVQTTTGTITTARFYAFKSFPATKYLPAFHRSACWQSNRNVVKWTYLPQPPEFDK